MYHTALHLVEGSRNGASLSARLLGGEPGGRAPLLVIPKDMLSKALEMDVCFPRGPAFGEHGGTLFPRAFERRDTFLYLGEFCKEFERYVKKAL